VIRGEEGTRGQAPSFPRSTKYYVPVRVIGVIRGEEGTREQVPSFLRSAKYYGPNREIDEIEVIRGNEGACPLVYLGCACVLAPLPYRIE